MRPMRRVMVYCSLVTLVTCGEVSEFRKRATMAGAKPWDVELKWKKKASRWDMVQRTMARSLQRISLERRRSWAMSTLRRSLQCVELVILFIEDRIFVSVDHHLMKDDQALLLDHLTFLKSLAERRGPNHYPNLLYHFERETAPTDSVPPTRCSNMFDFPAAAERLPRLVTRKVGGYQAPGVLFPSNIGNISIWESQGEAPARGGHSHQQESSTTNKCVWRGHQLASLYSALDEQHENKNTPRHQCDFGEWARFCALVRSRQAPDLLDIKVFPGGRLKPRDLTRDISGDPDCKALRYDHSMRQAAVSVLNNQSKFEFFQHLASEDVSTTTQHHPKRSHSHNHHGGNKGQTQHPSSSILSAAQSSSSSSSSSSACLLHMPDDTNLPNLWKSGAVVAMWNAPYMEWYFPALQHGRTHLSLDCHTVLDKLGRYLKMNNQPHLNRLRSNAATIFHKFLTPIGLDYYVSNVFNVMSNRTGQHYFFTDRFTRNVVLFQLECQKLKLMEFVLPSSPQAPRKEDEDAAGFLKLIPRNDLALKGCAQPNLEADAELLALAKSYFNSYSS